jgi:DNA primase
MEQVDDVKQKVNIVDIIGDYVPLKKAGRNFRGLCPFHNEKTPSFVVNEERQIWHCFGCQKGGDVFKFLMEIDHIEFLEALRILAKRVGIELKTYERSETVKLKDRIYEMNHLASEFYHYLLLSHKSGKDALSYILKRGIQKKSLETFKIGYAPNNWEALQKFLLKKGYSLFEMETAGLVVRTERGSYFDKFRGRLMFTLNDHRGNPIGFAGRIFEEAKDSTPKYMNTSETPVYTKGNVLYGLDITHDAIKRENLAVIVEGEIDCIQSFQAGVTNVVAIKGSALTEGHVFLLKRYTENVAISLDSDFAGDAAARRGIEIADAANLNIKVVQLKAGKDPDECVRLGVGLWKDSVSSAIPIYDFILKSSEKRNDVKTIEGKKRIGEEVLPIIAKISNLIVRAHYLKELASFLKVSEESVTSELERIVRLQNIKHPFISTQTTQAVLQRAREDELSEIVLAILFQSEHGKADFETIKSVLSRDDLSLPPYKKLFHLLGEYYEQNPKFSIQTFSNLVPKEIIETFDRIYLISLPVKPDSDDWEKFIVKTGQELRKWKLKKLLVELSVKIQEFEKNEDKKTSASELDKLNTQFMTISNELRLL